MKKALVAVLGIALLCVFACFAMAQVPNVQVYFDAAHTQTQTQCGPSGNLTTLYVVMNNWNMNVVGVDFSVNYPPSLIWVADVLPNPSSSTSVGQSPTGIAITYASCCYLSGFVNNEVLQITASWASCECGGETQPVVVGGYTPLGKTQPTAIRREDHVTFGGVGMVSLIWCAPVATQPSTWGRVKELYR